jgi:hypothetical protein
MHKTKTGRVLWLASLFCLALALGGFADPREQFAQETGLDLDLIQLVQSDVNGVELTVVFVFIDQRTFDSKISPALRSTLLPYVGQNAIYVNPTVKSVVERFDFFPMSIVVEQEGRDRFLPGYGDWREITAGFLAGVFQVNPAGPSQGSGSEGVLILGDAIDPTKPFSITYMGERIDFAIAPEAPASTAASAGASAATASHTPVEVAPLADRGSLEDVLGHEAFDAMSMAAFFDLDPMLVRTMTLTGRGEELRLLLFDLQPEIRNGALGADLLETIEPLIGTGAIMVWAFSPSGAAFSPWYFYIQQGGTNYVFFSSASFTDLTVGFLSTSRVEVGEVVAGVIRLPKGVDVTAPFSVYYGTTGVDFP